MDVDRWLGVDTMSIYPDDDLWDDDAPSGTTEIGCMRGVVSALLVELGGAVLLTLLIISALTVYTYLTTH